MASRMIPAEPLRPGQASPAQPDSQPCGDPRKRRSRCSRQGGSPRPHRHQTRAPQSAADQGTSETHRSPSRPPAPPGIGRHQETGDLVCGGHGLHSVGRRPPPARGGCGDAAAPQAGLPQEGGARAGLRWKGMRALWKAHMEPHGALPSRLPCNSPPQATACTSRHPAGGSLLRRRETKATLTIRHTPTQVLLDVLRAAPPPP